MSTKPTSLPIWAIDGAAQVTEPNLAKKQQGHVGDEPFFGDYENWYKRLVYLWTEYLRDGTLSGDHVFDGSVNVAGNLNIAGNLTVNGTIVQRGIQQIHLSVGPAAIANNLTGTSSIAAGNSQLITLPLAPGDNVLSVVLFSDPTGTGANTLEIIQAFGSSDPAVVLGTASDSNGAPGAKTYSYGAGVLIPASGGVVSLRYRPLNGAILAGGVVSFNHPP